MNRRHVLVGLAGLGLTGGSFWVASEGLPTTADDDEGLPVRVETLDAPGSTAGEALVPTPDTPTVIDLFATWCPPCDEQVAIIDAVRRDYPGVSFVSVTNERVGGDFTRADIAAWWDRHGGAWTLGLDPGGDLLRLLGATGLPYVAVADGDGRITYDNGGLVGEATLRQQLDAVV